MTDRMTRAWFLAGPLVMMGATWLAILVVTRSVEVSWGHYLNHAVGGLVGGLVIGRATTGLNRTAQLLAAGAALATIGVYALLFVVRGSYYFSWAPDRSDAPWLIVGLLAAVSVAAAVAGVVIARSWRSPHEVTRPAWVMVSWMMILGALTPFYTTGLFAADLGGLVVIATVVAGGALVQLLIPRRAIWLCGSGALMFALTALQRYASDELAGKELLLSVGVSLGFMWPAAALGARIAWRFSGRDEAAAEAEPELPAARVQ
jgi:hypothetical protein